MAENPPSVSRDLQRLESLDPSVKSTINRAAQKPGATTPGGSGGSSGGVELSHRAKVKMPEKLRLKELAMHELSTVRRIIYYGFNCIK